MSTAISSTSASSPDLNQYFEPEWSEDSDINPKTLQPWAANDTLTCSCGIIFTVHSKGFAALEQHHRSARHYDALRRRVRQAVNRAMLERAMADIKLGEAELAPALKFINTTTATKRDANGNPKHKPHKTTAPKTAPASGLSHSAQLKENALLASTSSSNLTSKLEQLRAELMLVKAEFKIAIGPAEGALAVKKTRLERQIKEAETMETLKQQRREEKARLSMGSKRPTEKADSNPPVGVDTDQEEDSKGSRHVHQHAKVHRRPTAKAKTVTFFED